MEEHILDTTKVEEFKAAKICKKAFAICLPRFFIRLCFLAPLNYEINIASGNLKVI